jgi:putative sigma-54 modulation protein
MKFTFTEKKYDASGELRAYAEKKIGKLEKFFRNESEAFITFFSERGRYTAEVTIKNNGMFYRVTETTSDMFASIDSSVAAIERQIRKNKTRLEKRLREGVFEKEAAINGYLSDVDEDKEFDVVRTKKFSIKPMTVDEAILQMNLLEHEFYVFKNRDDDENFAVVYRRTSGGYGLIECAD